MPPPKEPEYIEERATEVVSYREPATALSRYSGTARDIVLDTPTSTGYTRKSGFGYTKQNMNYSIRLNADTPASERFNRSTYDSRASANGQPTQYYKRSKYEDRPSNYSQRYSYTSRQGRASNAKVYREYIDKQKLTDEEYRLFKDFSTPIKLSQKRNTYA